MTGQFTDQYQITLNATEELARYRRVKLSGTRGAAYADAGEDSIGVVRALVASGDPAAVWLQNKQGTIPMVASGVISANALVYPANDGKITATVTGRAIGRALEAASGDASIIEVVPILHDLFSDVASVHGLFDDFNDMLLTGAERLWTGTQTDTGTITIIDSVGGVLQLEASDGSIGDNDESYAGTTNEPFLFANNKPLWFETRVKLGAADSDGANVMVGLVSAANAANSILDNGGGPLATYSGITIFKVDGGSAWQAECSIAGTQTTITLTAPGAPGTSYQKLAIEFIPTSSTVATVNIYVDGVLVGSTAAFTYTSATEMSAFVGVKNGGSTVNTTLHVDYVHVRQVR